MGEGNPLSPILLYAHYHIVCIYKNSSISMLTVYQQQPEIVMKDVKTLAYRHALAEQLLDEVRKGRKQNGEARLLLEEALIADFLNPSIEEINLSCASVLLSKAARKRLSGG